MHNVTHLGVTITAGILMTVAACTAPAEEADSPEPSVKELTSSRFERDGQQAFFHDEGDAYGFFHTYDAFSACGGQRKIHVLVPRDYEASKVRYPVIYMNDGNTAFWRGGIGNRTWGVQKTLGDLGGAIERPIVVAIEPHDREAEYTYASWAPLHAFGGLPAYAREVATCLKPWFDAHYRTKPEAASTGIVGSSHGGLASYWIASRFPGTFGFAAAMSSSFWAGLGGSRVRDSELVVPVAAALGTRPRPAFWIDWGLRRSNGTSDSVVEALATDTGKQMVATLKEFGYGGNELATLEDPVGGHDEEAWAFRFGEFVKWRLGRGK